MRGRKPKVNREADGDTRKVGSKKFREQLGRERKATRGLLPASDELTERASEIYAFYVAELKDLDLDKRPDSPILRQAAILIARAEKADLRIKELGEVVEEPIVSRDSGDIIGTRLKKNPWIDVSNRSIALAKNILVEFGLAGETTRLRLPKPDRENAEEDLAKLLMTPRATRVPNTVQ